LNHNGSCLESQTLIVSERPLNSQPVIVYLRSHDVS